MLQVTESIEARKKPNESTDDSGSGKYELWVESH